MRRIPGNPNNSNNIDELREWVLLLQEQVKLLCDMNESSRKMVEYGQKIREEQDKGIAILEAQMKTLTTRIAQYEMAFSLKAFNDVRRIN